MIKSKNKFKVILFFLLFLDLFFLSILLKPIFQDLQVTNLDQSKKDCIKKFPNIYQRQKCLDKYFQSLTMIYSPKEAIEEAILLKKQGILNQCHISAHSIGYATLKKNNFNVAKSLVSCPKGCLEGCQHGVVENFMSRIKSPEELLSSVAGICEGLTSKSLKYQCVHGIGHGLRKHGETELKTAIEVCQKFNESSDISSCLDGVFMENMNLYLGLSEKDLLNKLPSMCLQIEEQFSSKALYYCVRNIAEGLMFYTGGNIERANTFCHLLPSDYIKQCLISVEHEQFLDSRE